MIQKAPIKGLLRYLVPFIIVVLGAVLRFQAVQHTEVIAPIHQDAKHYVSYALNVLHHGVYSKQDYKPTDRPPPDALRPPGYPAFLATVLSLSPDLPVVLVQYIQAILSIGTILLSLFLFQKFLPPGWAYAATALVAISPHLVVANVYILTESLFTFGLIATLLFFSYVFDKGKQYLAFSSGAVLGLLTLTRSAVQYLLLVVVLLFYFKDRPRGFVFLVVLGFLVVVGSWSVRNLVVTGESSADRQTINFLHHGMYPDFKYQNKPETYRYPYRFDPNSRKISSSVWSVLTEIWSRFRDEPIRHARWFLIGKPVAFWQWDIVQGMGDLYIYPVRASPYFSMPLFQWTYMFSKLLHTPLVVLGLLGSVFCWVATARQLNPSSVFCVHLIASIIIYYQLIHMIGAPFPRYSIPLRPLIYGLAVYFVFSLYELAKFRHKRVSKG